MHHAHLTESINNGSLAATGVLDRLHASGLGATQALANVDRLIDQQAYVMSADDIFYAGAIIFLCLIPLLWLTSRRRASAAAAAQGSGAH